jgi:WD40 repeat protein
MFVLNDNLLFAQTPIYFEDAVAPILRKNCTACHNAKLAEGGLKLETPADLVKGGDSGPAFDPAKIDASLLLTRPVGDADTIMPPNGNKVGAERLTPEQIAVIKGWIVGGALSRGPSQSMTNHANLRLPDGARASYAVAMSPDSSFIAYGRGGELVIHHAERFAGPLPLTSAIDAPPLQVISNAHPDFIQAIAVSPDGQRIATGSTGQVKIWKRSEPSLDAARPALAAVGIDLSKLLCVSADNTLFATLEVVPADPNTPAVGPSSAIKLTKKDGSVLHSFSVADASITAGVLNPSNNRLFAVGVTNTLFSWDLTAAPPVAPTTTALPAPVRSLNVVDDANLLIVSDRKASVWQIKSPTLTEIVADHPLATAINAAGPVDGLSLSPDRQLGCSLTTDESTGNTALKLWNVAQAKLVGAIERDRKEQLVLAGSDRELRRNQAMLDRFKAMVAEHEKTVQAEEAAVKSAQEVKDKAALAMDAKTKELQTAMQVVTDHEKAMAEAKTAMEAAMAKLTQLTTELEPKKKAYADVEKKTAETKMMLDNANQALVGIQENQKSAVAKLEERKQSVVAQTEVLTTIQTKNAGLKTANEAVRFSVQSVAFDGFGRVSASKLKDKAPVNEIDFFSIDTLERTESRVMSQTVTSAAELSAIVREVRSTWQQESMWDSPAIVVDRATALAFSPDGSAIAIGSGLASRSGQLAIVNVADGKPLKTMPELHSDTILGVGYSPDGRWLASCGADKMTKLLNAQSFEPSKIFEGHTHHVLALAWQEDANRLATASADMTVKIWDIEKGESVKTVAGFGTEVTSIAFLGSTANTVSATMNKLVRMHDSNSGNQGKQFGPVPDSLYCVVASPNGKFCIATGQEGIARVWQIEDGKLVAEWK